MKHQDKVLQLNNWFIQGKITLDEYNMWIREFGRDASIRLQIGRK